MRWRTSGGRPYIYLYIRDQSCFPSDPNHLLIDGEYVAAASSDAAVASVVTTAADGAAAIIIVVVAIIIATIITARKGMEIDYSVGYSGRVCNPATRL